MDYILAMTRECYKKSEWQQKINPVPDKFDSKNTPWLIFFFT